MAITAITKGCDFTLRFAAKRIGINRYVKVSFVEVSNIIVNLVSLPSTKTPVSHTIDEQGRLVVDISGEDLDCNTYGIEINGFYNNGNWRHQIAPAFEIVMTSTEDNYALTETDNLTLDFDIIIGETYVSSRAFGGTIDAILAQIQEIIQSVTDAVSGASSAVNTHNTSNTAHEDIRQLISSVSSTLANLQEQVWASDTTYISAIEDLQNQINAIIAGSASASLTASKTTVFKGVSTPITLLAKCSPAAETITIKKGNTVISTGTGGSLQASVNVDTQADVTYTAEFTMSGGTITAEVKIKAVSPIFFGAGLDESDITSEASVRASVAGTYSINVPDDNMYIFFIIPANMTQIKSASEGPITFPLSDPPTDTTRVVEGTTVNYKVYQSNALIAGDYIITLT